LDNVVDSGSFRILLVEYEFLEHITLEYLHLTHEIRVRGHNSSINHKIGQYLVPSFSTSEPTGAFGQNPQVAEYLMMQKIFLDS